MEFKSEHFPNLHRDNHRGAGPAADDGEYNCIAWAAGYRDRFWDPFGKPEDGIYWPEGVTRDYKPASLIMAFRTQGFADRTADGKPVDGTLETGIEKIAIYADEHEYTHAARQLETGKWTSKMGLEGERIEHDAPENLVGSRFAQIATFMQRVRLSSGSFLRFFYLFPLGYRSYIRDNLD